MKQKSVGVFISYSSEDRVTATLFADRIREMGYQAWIDFAGLKGGDEWRTLIDEALMQSVAVLVLLTPEAARSQWVHYEVKRAKELNHPIIPLMVRTCELPAALEHLHYVDFRNRMAPAFAELAQALVQAVLRKSVLVASDTESNRARFLQEIEKLRPAEAEDSASETVEVVQVPPTTILQKPLALVVEDQASTQTLLRDLLEEDGLEVHVANTRNEATALIRKHHYQFITLDMKLGPDDANGQEGVYLLELLERYQTSVPIIMITDLDLNGRQTREFLVMKGVKDILDKPIKPAELHALVRRFVGTGAE